MLMTAKTIVPVLLITLLVLGVLGYLVVLLIRALRKYLRSAPVRGKRPRPRKRSAKCCAAAARPAT